MADVRLRKTAVPLQPRTGSRETSVPKVAVGPPDVLLVDCTVCISNVSLSYSTYYHNGCELQFGYAPNPLHTFPRNFPADGEAANLLSPDHTGDYSPRIRRQSPKTAATIVAYTPTIFVSVDMAFQTCCGLVVGLLRGKW